MNRRRTMVIATALCSLIALTAALGQFVPPSEQALKLKRANYDRYLWRLAHHPDTFAAFELIINNDPKKPNPWAWRLNCAGAAYYSRKQFDTWLQEDLKRFYGPQRAKDEYARRQQFAKKIDHSLWEMFQALCIYNREVFLTNAQVEQATREARKTVPQNPALIERLKSTPFGDPLPPQREQPPEDATP